MVINNIGEKYAVIDNFDKTVMFFDKSVRLYNGIKIYNEVEKSGASIKSLKNTYSYAFSDYVVCVWNNKCTCRRNHS